MRARQHIPMLSCTNPNASFSHEKSSLFGEFRRSHGVRHGACRAGAGARQPSATPGKSGVHRLARRPARPAPSHQACRSAAGEPRGVQLERGAGGARAPATKSRWCRRDSRRACSRRGWRARARCASLPTATCSSSRAAPAVSGCCARPDGEPRKEVFAAGLNAAVRRFLLSAGRGPAMGVRAPTPIRSSASPMPVATSRRAGRPKRWSRGFPAVRPLDARRGVLDRRIENVRLGRVSQQCRRGAREA